MDVPNLLHTDSQQLAFAQLLAVRNGPACMKEDVGKMWNQNIMELYAVKYG